MHSDDASPGIPELQLGRSEWNRIPGLETNVRIDSRAGARGSQGGQRSSPFCRPRFPSSAKFPEMGLGGRRDNVPDYFADLEENRERRTGLESRCTPMTQALGSPSSSSGVPNGFEFQGSKRTSRSIPELELGDPRGVNDPARFADLVFRASAKFPELRLGGPRDNVPDYFADLEENQERRTGLESRCTRMTQALGSPSSSSGVPNGIEFEGSKRTSRSIPELELGDPRVNDPDRFAVHVKIGAVGDKVSPSVAGPSRGSGLPPPEIPGRGQGAAWLGPGRQVGKRIPGRD